MAEKLTAKTVLGSEDKDRENDDLKGGAAAHAQVYWALYLAFVIFIGGLFCFIYYGMPGYEEIYETSDGLAVTLLNNDISTNRIAFFSGIMLYVGVVIGFLGVIFQSRYRINIEVLSKNRQNWINDLRERLAITLSIGSEALSIFEDIQKCSVASYNTTPIPRIYADKSALEIKGLSKKLLLQYYYIKLLLSVSQQKNDIDKNLASGLIITIESVNNIISDADSLGMGLESSKINQLRGDLGKLVLQGERIIKREWRKVKKGL